MTFDNIIEFRDKGKIPGDIPELLRALLIDASGDWDEAHRIAQEDNSEHGSLVHAYLHRKEGDLWNARYWYSRAGREMPEESLEQEWESIARELINP